MNPDEILSDIESKGIGYGDVDYIALDYWINKVTEVGSLILGILTVLIIILVPLNVTIELMYININIVREYIEKTIEKNKKPSSVAAFICRDAKKAVEQSIIEKRGNANLNYCIIKCKSVVFVSFILAIVLQGTSMIITKSYGIVGGLVEVIEKMIS